MKDKDLIKHNRLKRVTLKHFDPSKSHIVSSGKHLPNNGDKKYTLTKKNDKDHVRLLYENHDMSCSAIRGVNVPTYRALTP